MHEEDCFECEGEPRFWATVREAGTFPTYCLVMPDKFLLTPVRVRESVRALGGDAFIALIQERVECEGEYAVDWLDAYDDNFYATDVADWFFEDLRVFGESVAYLRLSIDVWGCSSDDEDPRPNRGITGYLRIRLGPPHVIDRFDLDPDDLHAFVWSDAAGADDLDEATRADIARFLGKAPSRGTVWIRETEHGLEVSGLPAPPPTNVIDIRGPHED